MKRPEKCQELANHILDCPSEDWMHGYNQAIDDMNKWIDEADIKNEIRKSSK